MNTINKLALIATILLTASLSAFAQASKIHIDTSVEDFNYETLSGTLKIQSFVENDIIDPTVVIKPMDIVLVLDISSSMSTNVSVPTYTARSSQAYNYNGYGSNTYYYLYEGKYYPVSRGRSGNSSSTYRYYLKFNTGTKDYYLTSSGLSETQPTNITSNTSTIWTGVLYTKGSTNKSRLAVMKSAAANFVDLINAKSSSSVDNRIALVKFDKNATTVSGLVSVKDNATQLKTYLNGFSPGSGTGTGNGMKNAQTIINGLSADELSDRDQTVILFSDGDADDFYSEADAINASLSMKGKGVTVYSIGLTGGMSTHASTVMDYISSDYPNVSATGAKSSLSVSNTTKASSDYYFKTTDGADLDDIFSTIAEKLEPAKIYVGVETKMQGGTLQSSISLNLPSATSTIDAKTASLTGYSNGTFTFSSTEEDVSGITFDKNTLTATGFDYSANWCGLEGTAPHGKALILRIPFTFTPTSVNQELELYESGKTPGLYDKNANEYVLAAAPPAPEFAKLIIEKKGLSNGESAIFDLDRVKLTGESADVHVNRIVLTGTSSGGAVSYTVPFLNPEATYYVTERTDWSWTYDPQDTKDTSTGFVKKSQNMTEVTSGTTAKLTFTNTKYSADKLSSNAEALKQ